MHEPRAGPTSLSEVKGTLHGLRMDWSGQDIDPSCGAHITVGSPQEAQLHAQLRAMLPPALVEENAELADAVALCCLRFRRYDLPTAQERLQNYLQWRRQTFGTLAPHRLSDDSRMLARIGTQVMKILPRPLPSGERLVLMQLRLLRADVFSPLETLKAWHYWMMRSLRESPELQVHGITLLVLYEGMHFSQFDPRVPKAILGAISKCVPIRLNRIFAIKPGTFFRILLPVIQFLLSAKLRERLTVIHDFEELHGHLPRELLPLEVGGEQAMDAAAWAEQRLEAVV
eukprot:GGOE01045459.1.p1 GENE.GGOE01045459.1~~GGOE01045459.1.p1  ORF type:complete len:334 (-),score=106.39 GGOE01045459.1:120-977(-)